MSSVNTVMAGQFQIAVAKQQLQAVEQQGKDAVKLIQSASADNAAHAPPNQATGVGTTLNVVG